MSSENTLTGRRGKVIVGGGFNRGFIAFVTEWSVNPTMATSSEWGDSGRTYDGALFGSPEGYTNREPGKRSASMDIEGKYDATFTKVFHLFQPGDIGVAELWLNNVDLYWYFPRALCNDFNITVDVDSEEVIGWESSWGSDGRYYYPGESGQPSASLPEEAIETIGDETRMGYWESAG